MKAAHETRCGARVLSPKVALVRGGEVVESGEHRQALAEALNSLKDRWHLEIDALRGWSPLTHIGAISDINRRKPRHAFRLGTERRQHGIEKRKGYRCTNSAEESPPWQSSLYNDHLTS